MSLVSTFAQATGDFNFNTSEFDTFTTTPTVNSTVEAGVALGVVLVVVLISVVVYIFLAVCLMKIFKKAGRQDAWAAWVPIYNMWVYFEIAGRPGWWALLSLISPLNLILGIIGSIDLAKRFSKEAGFGVLLGLLPVVGYPLLAFGDAQYQGSAADTVGSAEPVSNPPPQPPNQPLQ